ncbi:MAG: DNA cytosine methyltransferase [Verrucomicrobia bacterium]|nr:MAG: DNA cytosine methyltransferase [Verrucomicrobiota bacterium]
MNELTAVELCAGAGGQALGLEHAGFRHLALVEIDAHCCNTLRANRKDWNVIHQDLREFDGRPFKGVDLLAGGLPCPPFSVAGKQLGDADERNLFPEGIRLVKETRPRAVMLENVRGILDAVFEDYRQYISGEIASLGYRTDWRLLNASDYKVPQLRPRVVFMALRNDVRGGFPWPAPSLLPALTVGDALHDLLASKGWMMAKEWRKRANVVAPTIVGGSKKHGGPDLGPTRSKRAWASLGIDGMGIANEPPDKNFVGMPRLTVRMAARVQGFPDDWEFTGSKTAAYRQVGNAFPPPVAAAVAAGIFQSLQASSVANIALA